MVVALAAVVGAGLGLDGAHAPSLQHGLSGISASDARVARPNRPRVVPPSSGTSGGTPGSAAATAGPGSAPGGAATGAGPGTASGSTPPQAPAGPRLSDTPYGAYAYQVYPSSPSADTQRALTGFHLAFRHVDAATVEVTVADVQDGTTQSATFASNDRLYFIETRMGDDGFGGETNFGDDGFILTDAAGHVLSH